MKIHDIVNRDLVNLSTCESEPIHIPGSIQPHGFLLAIKETDGRIIYCSENAASFLNGTVPLILSSTLGSLLGNAAWDDLQKYLSQIHGSAEPFEFTIGNRDFYADIHRSSGMILFEAETIAEDAAGVPGLYKQTNRFVAHMQHAGSFLDLAQTIAEETKAVTGYDRVMIYQFDEHYNGEVIAESRRHDLVSFAKQKYPHTDIPAQARELYLRNQIRIIADVNYVPVPIFTAAELTTNEALDLSLSVFRSVSPIHIEYLKNMGVGATLTVSLIQDGKLWGLIACHHYSPKRLPHNAKLAVLLQGNFLTSQIKVRAAAEEFEAAKKTEEDLKIVMNLLADSEDFIKTSGSSELIAHAVNATGTIIYHNGIFSTAGAVPPENELMHLVDFLSEKYHRRVYTTTNLSEDYPAACPYADTAAGLIYHPLSFNNRDCIIWLRKEIVDMINWAGNPYKGLEKDDTVSRLTPRKSFELWTEEVRHRSRPWTRSDMYAAESFAYALQKHLNLLRAKEQELVSRRVNEALEAANKELKNINWISTHDLKEPIRKIQIFASQLLDQENSDIPERALHSVGRMKKAAERMQDLIDDILSYSRSSSSPGQEFIETDLNRILTEVLADLEDEVKSLHAVVNVEALPVLKVIPFQVKQLFTNILVNAFKFTEPHISPIVTIQPEYVKELDGAFSVESDTDYYHISFADNGIGFDPANSEKIFEVFRRLHSNEEYKGTGVGLAICRKIMENHRGFIKATAAPGAGTTIHLYFPAKDKTGTLRESMDQAN